MLFFAFWKDGVQLQDCCAVPASRQGRVPFGTRLCLAGKRTVFADGNEQKACSFLGVAAGMQDFSCPICLSVVYF